MTNFVSKIVMDEVKTVVDDYEKFAQKHNDFDEFVGTMTEG